MFILNNYSQILHRQNYTKKNYPFLIWNSILIGCFVFYLAILVWKLNRRDKKPTKTSIYKSWKKRNLHPSVRFCLGTTSPGLPFIYFWPMELCWKLHRAYHTWILKKFSRVSGLTKHHLSPEHATSLPRQYGIIDQQYKPYKCSF